MDNVAHMFNVLQKQFKAKNLAILRACNELLRRLSRAEDTVFCGRVFIFLFQTFPLGDRSSVNLRGEFHVDNVTTYDQTNARVLASTDHMDIDVDEITEHIIASSEQVDSKSTDLRQPIYNEELIKDNEAVKLETKDQSSKDDIVDVNALYPIFWSLQDYFSTPTKLFETANLKSLRSGLETTLTKFKEVQKDVEIRDNSKAPEETRRGKKRKRGNDEETASSFNPKYLTSRDLFELEVCYRYVHIHFLSNCQ